MKLKDLLKVIFSNGPLLQRGFEHLEVNSDYYLGKDYIDIFKDLILDCEEFTDVTELVVLGEPRRFLNDRIPQELETIKLSEDTKFSGRCFLYSISLTPPEYNLSNVFRGTNIKNNSVLLPTQYDPETFTPHKEIRMRWSPEMEHDVGGYNLHVQEESLRERMHRILDDILDNPTDYEIKPKRNILVRGSFVYNNLGDGTPQNIYF